MGALCPRTLSCHVTAFGRLLSRLGADLERRGVRWALAGGHSDFNRGRDLAALLSQALEELLP
ncbi:MAG TPA: hypothetical protein VGO93_17250 [Candidatus Xenobia bacterium]